MENQTLTRLKALNCTTGKFVEIIVSEKQICFEGLRNEDGILIWGVPHRDKNDCLRYCALEHCEH